MYATSATAGTLLRATARRTRLHISYRDADGNATRRTIAPDRTYTGKGRLYVEAWCELASERRTFRADRITRCEPADSRPTPPPVAPVRPAPVAPAPPPDPAVAAPSPLDRNQSGAWPMMIWIAVIVGASLVVFSQGGHRTPPRRAAAPLAAPGTRFLLRPLEELAQQSPLSESASIIDAYHGAEIWTDPGRDTAQVAPQLRVQAATRRGLELAIARTLFRTSTGVVSTRLEQLYADADRDGNGQLTWQEISFFQRWLYSRYEYAANATALRPDEFLYAGGGDCEDWSLVTAGLLRFWNWEVYVASFREPDGAGAHAIAFVPVADPPPGFTFYQLQDYRDHSGRPVPDSAYVPIDYQFVGGHSSAMDASWELRTIYRPESIYGRHM